MQETWVWSRVGKIPWRRERLPTLVFWPGEFHGLYSPWAHKESDTTERLSLHFTSESQGPSCKPWKLYFLAMSQSWVPSYHDSTAICPGLSSSPDHQWRVFTASWSVSGPCLKSLSIFNWSTVDLLYFKWTMLCSFLLYSQVIQLCTHFFRFFPIIVYYKILKSFLCYIVGPCCLSILHMFMLIHSVVFNSLWPHGL